MINDLPRTVTFRKILWVYITELQNMDRLIKKATQIRSPDFRKYWLIML
jgi:hypothetical protein